MAADQRKRTMDALERRFAVAKAELLQQQQKKHRLTHHEEHRRVNNDVASTPSLRADAPKVPSLSRSSKKGSSFFFGYAPSQDPDENGLAYSQLPQAVHENLLKTDVKFKSKKESAVDKILHDLFQHGDASQKYMQGSRNIKIDNWILLDNYVPSKSTGSHTRASRSNSKCSRRPMSMKQHKKLGTFNLPQDLQKFDIYKPMHEIWKDYMMQLLKKTGRNELPKYLLSADLHGAAILVADCKIKSFTGITGIMIRETVETFGIITQDNKFQVVPKKLSVFIFQIDCWKITMNGDKLSSRNSGFDACPRNRLSSVSVKLISSITHGVLKFLCDAYNEWGCCARCKALCLPLAVWRKVGVLKPWILCVSQGMKKILDPIRQSHGWSLFHLSPSNDSEVKEKYGPGAVIPYVKVRSSRK
ncbi:unnamed protein product [Dovyalis caffra]|uniref:Uncharacterized protein n=1 Tax=Dovyalis caffra TaxID=77055 RepID=A0AAV1RI85_9ROSI|nr:unnamed protein product [Dovyalis caffra]